MKLSLICRGCLIIALCCASARAADDTGKLLIIGGGMTAAMAPTVYGELAKLMPEHGTLGYIPTAGETVKDPNNPDNRLASNLKGRTIKVIDLPPDKPQNADDPAIAKEIENCDAIFFGGGAQSRIVNIFHPDGKETLASKAVDKVLARGGVVAGTSAGAECMTDPMIYKGESDEALADPKSLPIGRGMGFFKFGLVDQHFLQRGRFGRLVVAMERTNQDFGFGISEARAVLVDRKSGLITTIGPDAVVFLNRTKANGRNNWRVSLLGDGDTIEGKTGAITPSAARVPFGVNNPSKQSDVTDPWSKMAVSTLIDGMLVGNGPTTGRLIDKSQTLTFTLDGSTKVFAEAKGDAHNFSVIDLRMDVTPTINPTTTKPTTRPATVPADITKPLIHL